MTQDEFTHEMIRRDFWIKAWCSVASASDCHDSSVPGDWADRALRDFDEKFPKPLTVPLPPGFPSAP